MKAVMLASQNIQTGQRDLMIAGGMESMSGAPLVFFLFPRLFSLCHFSTDSLIRLNSFYIPRTPATFGHYQAQDAVVKDGLTDVYGDYPMGIW